MNAIDEAIRAEMERARLAGLAIAMVSGQRIIWSQGYGSADIEAGRPMTPDTVFAVQSVTKPVVATALMQCFERGQFDLDDPVNDHFAPIRLQNQFEEQAPVTIRRLLTHTAGLPVDIGVSLPPMQPRSLEEHVATVVKTVRPPGGEIVYANWGYDAIGYLIQRLTGRPFDEYLRDSVFEPLGMDSSAIGAAPEGRPVAKGDFLSAVDGTRHAAELLPWALKPPNPSGALFSTVKDLARFLIAHLNGGVYEDARIIKADTVAEMHRLHAPSGNSAGGMGLGFRVDCHRGKHLICHGGDGLGYTIFLAGLPDEKVGVVLAMNTGNAQTSRSVVANAALRLLAPDDEPAGPLADTAQSTDPNQISGAYRSTFWDIEAEIRISDGFPVATINRGLIVGSGGDSSTLLPVGVGLYRAEGGFFDGFDLAFELGDNSKAARFFGGVYPFQFEREGDASAARELVVDEIADLTGRWSGNVESPLGTLPFLLDVTAGSTATVTALSARDAAVEEFSAASGRVSGAFDVIVPGYGDFRVFLRLSAAAGKLRGYAFARSKFGEVSMSMELTRR
jgi:CubicO group peptidase (beta-lactamase class C family)